MRRQVANPLAEQVLSGEVSDGARVEIDVADGGEALTFVVTDGPAAEESSAANAEPEADAEPVAV